MGMTTKQILQGVHDWTEGVIVYDISAAHNNTKYADLAAALGTNGVNVPEGLRNGGMSVKFIQGTEQSSDNKYVQFRYMGTATTGTPNPFLDTANWHETEDVTIIAAPVNATDATLPIMALTTEVGKYYRVDVPVETLAITLPLMTDNSKVQTVVIYLTGGTTPAVTISGTAPSGETAPAIYYQDGFEIAAGSTYEINCLWNGSAWIVAGVEIKIV